MGIRFGRNIERQDQKIENVGDIEQAEVESSIDNPYDDEFDKKLDAVDEKKIVSARQAFVDVIKVEQPQKDTPLMLAYKELEFARQSGSRDEIIKAEDRILDLERQEQEREYKTRITELKQMQSKAKESNDIQGLERFSKMRNSLVREMRYDELNYKIRKLQNSQRLAPSKEKLQEIIELKQELDTLELDEINK